MLDQKKLTHLYETHKIKERYNIPFPQFVIDFGESILPQERKNPDLDVIVQRLMQIYESKQQNK